LVSPSFSRHAKADVSIALVIWVNENVGFSLNEVEYAKHFEWKYYYQREKQRLSRN